METLIEAIRAASAADATPQARANGAQACRTILAALEATQGQPLASAPAAPAAPPTPMHAIVGTLRNTPPEQLLDLIIAKLTAALPPGTDVPKVQSVSLPLVPIGALRGEP